MAEPLRLLDTVKLTFEHVWENRAAISLVVVIAAAIESTTTWIAYDFMQPTHAVLLHKLIDLLVYTAIAISVHRLLLNAEQPSIRLWQKREVRFMGWLLFIFFSFALIYTVFGIFLSQVGDKPFESFKRNGIIWLFLLSSLPGAYLCARLSMLLPATAIDRTPKLAWSWALTKGNGIKLVVLLWFLPLAFTMFYAGWSTESPVMYLAVNLVINVLTALEIALLSVAFKTLGGMSFKTPAEIEAQPL